MLVCSLYNPSKHSYSDADLIDYVVNFTENILEKHPNTVIVSGGDMNRLDISRLEELTGWNALVDFPTHGNACLDNCLTNRPELFLSVCLLIC